MCLRHRYLENTIGKGEIALNEQFVLFALYFLPVFTEPKKKLSQNRTSRWAYSLRKKKKIDTTSNETEISNEINDFQTVHEL